MGRRSGIPLREMQIVNYLTNKEANSREISVGLEIPYPTVRRIINGLVESKRIKELRVGIDGFVYTTSNNDPMPVLNHRGESSPIIAYAHAMGENAAINGGTFRGTNIENSIHATAMVIASICKQAYNLAEHGFIDEKELREDRKHLISAEQTLLGFASLIRQMLDDPYLWNKDGLIQFQYSGQYDKNVINRAYNALWTKRSEPTNENEKTIEKVNY